jgi:GSH-dependent disulfide-bond oxidoreductase
MIELYTWNTPNGRKISMMLEEVGLPYTVHPVDIRKNEQFTPAFIAINPNGKIPAIVDTDGPGGKPLSIFESGAILIYLGEKSGKLYPQDPRQRMDVLQWLMFQMGGVGPMFGQNHHFRRAAPEKIAYGIERYGKETERLYGVLDARLKTEPYLAAGQYTIADIATYPWVSRHDWQEVKLEKFPNVKRWFDDISKRPATVKGMAIPSA